jgi:hypothetical protein
VKIDRALSGSAKEFPLARALMKGVSYHATTNALESNVYDVAFTRGLGLHDVASVVHSIFKMADIDKAVQRGICSSAEEGNVVSCCY